MKNMAGSGEPQLGIAKLLLTAGAVMSVIYIEAVSCEAWGPPPPSPYSHHHHQNFALFQTPNYRISGLVGPVGPLGLLPDGDLSSRYVHHLTEAEHNKRNVHHHQTHLATVSGITAEQQVRARSAQPAIPLRKSPKTPANTEHRNQFQPIFDEDQLAENLLNIPRVPSGSENHVDNLPNEINDDIRVSLPVISVGDSIEEVAVTPPSVTTPSPSRRRIRPRIRPAAKARGRPNNRPSEAPEATIPVDIIPDGFTIIPAVPDREVIPSPPLLGGPELIVDGPEPFPLPSMPYDNIPARFMPVPAVPPEDFVPPPPPPPPPAAIEDFPEAGSGPILPPTAPRERFPPRARRPKDNKDDIRARPEPSLVQVEPSLQQQSAPLRRDRVQLPRRRKQQDIEDAEAPSPIARPQLSASRRQDRQPVPRHSPPTTTGIRGSTNSIPRENNILSTVTSEAISTSQETQRRPIEIILPQRDRRKEFKRCHGKCVQAFCIPVEDLDVYEKCVEKCKKPCQ